MSDIEAWLPWAAITIINVGLTAINVLLHLQ
jgi:hypothetical protein